MQENALSYGNLAFGVRRKAKEGNLIKLPVAIPSKKEIEQAKSNNNSLHSAGLPMFIQKEIACIKPDHAEETLMYWNSVMGHYECWSCFKRSFDANLDNISEGFIKGVLAAHPESFVQTTFRARYELSKLGDMKLFDKSLIGKGVMWFCYIKFYVDENLIIRPLFVGAAGSTLVKDCDIPVDFSDNPDSGVAERYLHDCKFSWYKTFILVVPCYSRLDALDKKKLLQSEYHLFAD